MQYTNITLEDLSKEKILGEGTYGKCYLVENKRNNEKCVLKQIQIFGMSQQQQQQVIKQAKILSVLEHPNIVKFLSFFKTESYLNIVMEYADGGDLNKAIRDAKGIHFSQNQILNWFTQICLAIQHIHEKKVIHRDLKCQNIFMTKDGNIKLGDFGIAKHLSKTLEKIKTMVGTPYYMSPEICENKDYSFKTDIWSLGVILYEMCQLKLPFDGSSLPVLALKISRGEYPAINANYSKELKMLVKSLLQNNPSKRPPINKILQNPLISKRITQQYSPKYIVKELSIPELISRNLQQKQNDQEVFQQSIKDSNSINNKSDLDYDKRNEVHSARSHNANVKQSRTPKNSQISTNKLKDFCNSKSGKSQKEKEKKRKVQSFKRREYSEPNLAMRKNPHKIDPIQLVKEEENEEKEDCFQNIQTTLKNMIEQKFKQKMEYKIKEVSKGYGFAGESFNGNGIVSLLYGIQNFNQISQY